MSVNDVKIISGIASTRKVQVRDRTETSATVTLKPGEPVMVDTTTDYGVILVANGSPKAGSDQLVGIVIEESTETATVDGWTKVAEILPVRTKLSCKATTTTNVDTESEINALIGDWVTFDVTSLVVTIDEDEGTDVNAHGLKIIGGDPVNYHLDFIVSALVCEGAGYIGQNID